LPCTVMPFGVENDFQRAAQLAQPLVHVPQPDTRKARGLEFLQFFTGNAGAIVLNFNQRDRIRAGQPDNYRTTA